jgi:hypothetical protein
MLCGCLHTVYGLFSWNAADTNNDGKAKRANNPNEYKNISSAIAEGKHEHTDANVMRNVEVRSFTPTMKEEQVGTPCFREDLMQELHAVMT